MAEPIGGLPIRAERLAIVGLACRVPGASTPEQFWQLLIEGRDEITRIPADRREMYDGVAAATDVSAAAQWGGFLPDLDRFDPDFFNISPAEAPFIDPQQRLFLQVAWECLEDAGIVPSQLAGSRTGVFVGQATHDHAMLWGTQSRHAGPYSNPGYSHAVTANRISYLLDLHGPSLAVDTACSSSLVAVHLAAQSIAAGECDSALVGGVSVLLSASPQVGAARLTALAIDGRCRAFDAAGSGYVRSEGAGAVMVKRLRDAERDGDFIYAVIESTVMNQDGRTNGLTAPSGRAQTALISSAIIGARLRPADVDYVEAHGTGTPLGDPIEARALGTALAERDRPLLIGSAKANVGHLEAAAGITGLIKVALMLRHRLVPPTPHFTKPNPLIDMRRLRLVVPTTVMDWPDTGRRAVAGVSSFGFGGTNAHVVLSGIEPRPAQRHAEPAHDEPVLFALSGRRAEAVRSLAAAHLATVATADGWSELAARAAATQHHRAHHNHRAAVVGDRLDDIVAQLTDLADGRATTHQTTGRRAPRLAFIYSGHGSQWEEMGRELLDRDAAFTDAVDTCDHALTPTLGWSVAAVLRGHQSVDLDDIAVSQPFEHEVDLEGVVDVRRAGGARDRAGRGRRAQHG